MWVWLKQETHLSIIIVKFVSSSISRRYYYREEDHSPCGISVYTASFPNPNECLLYIRPELNHVTRCENL